MTFDGNNTIYVNDRNFLFSVQFQSMLRFETVTMVAICSGYKKDTFSSKTAVIFSLLTIRQRCFLEKYQIAKLQKYLKIMIRSILNRG